MNNNIEIGSRVYKVKENNPGIVGVVTNKTHNKMIVCVTWFEHGELIGEMPEFCKYLSPVVDHHSQHNI